MTALHTEQTLEDEICRDLAAAGWLHEAGDAARYDRALALFPDDVAGWIQTTQPEAWASIEQTHGANARKVVCERLRRTLADAHPWLPGALLKAFTQARRLAQEALADTSATKVTMPFVEDNLARARALMGPDIWTYGLDGNRHVLETFLAYHHAQGLSPRKVAVEELFHPATLEFYSL